ncbi:MAG: hypothetical protein A2W11_02095 [Ignavibacteria bacterium RBG_16_35_7]|nr:MAG: hypothetical protein A2W11_02095 [Ignavibacteria bacterium RBG_16_35_7]
MTQDEKYTALKKIFWDYNIEMLPLKKIASRQFPDVDKYEYDLVINRMLERMSWIELLDILGIDELKKILTRNKIKKLRSNELKDRYERIRRILFKEPLSLSGWDTEYIKRIKATLLSNRWYTA